MLMQLIEIDFEHSKARVKELQANDQQLRSINKVGIAMLAFSPFCAVKSIVMLIHAQNIDILHTAQAYAVQMSLHNESAYMLILALVAHCTCTAKHELLACQLRCCPALGIP